jgi:hypothetical protein
MAIDILSTYHHLIGITWRFVATWGRWDGMMSSVLQFYGSVRHSTNSQLGGTAALSLSSPPLGSLGS